MLLLLTNLFINLFNFDAVKAKKYAMIFIVCLISLVLLFSIFWIKSCFTKELKIDQESINKINTLNEKERKVELQKIIEANQEVIRTIDDRNTIIEETVEKRDAEIDKKIDDVDKKIKESRANGEDVTSEELKCILIPKNCE